MNQQINQYLFVCEKGVGFSLFGGEKNKYEFEYSYDNNFTDMFTKNNSIRYKWDYNNNIWKYECTQRGHSSGNGYILSNPYTNIENIMKEKQLYHQNTIPPDIIYELKNKGY